MRRELGAAALAASLAAFLIPNELAAHLVALALSAPFLPRLKWIERRPLYLLAGLAVYAAAFALDYFTVPPERVSDLALALAIAPVVEEVVFRGLFFDVLPAWLAAPLSAIAFAALHPYPLVALAYAIALTLVYWGSGLTGSIALHAANNLAWALLYGAVKL
ncbi:MAG: lysostaphin resistance A-like protein [Thermoproteus sp. AZ2]|jgi:membrane protease YdiL (CAAX protease family)|uniref:Lysostaphin resistance A-like protein n=1 Tax=Thermoproteus sp. AZ2 TaxID=1609232 RepID=A0ACC6UZ35_9CREN|nr:MAG: hypothetical protein TU35_02005 [Thermoproteus sp. AZ2]